MTAEQIVIAIVCYLGVMAGAALPYLRKRTAVSTWDHKYTLAMIAACFLSAITLEAAVLDYARTVSFGDAFLMPLFTAFATGFGLVTGTSEILKIYEGIKARWTPPEA